MPFRRAREAVGQNQSHTQESRPRFRYKPLANANDLRILKVSHVGAQGDDVGMPVLSIAHADLTHGPTYIAISYMWGSSKEEVDLIVDGHILKVRANLRDMIADLCHEHQVRYLWVDAICINQDDIPERSSQVRRIGDIYSRANYVIAYLRGNNHRTYRASYLAGRSRRYLSLYSTIASIREAVNAGSLQALRRGLDYERFFNNDYFIRRWIIQEVCLARSVIIRCDGYELSMGRLDEYLAIFGTAHGYADSRAAKISNLRRRMLTGNSARLEDLLYEHKNAACTERLDRIYALLSLASAGKEHVPVDYSMPPLRLLILVVHTAWLHERLDRARIFSFACFLRQNLEIGPMEFDVGIQNPIPLQDVTEVNPLLARVRVRGVLHNMHVDALIEDGLHRSRPNLPTMRHYRSIKLNRLASSPGGDHGSVGIYKPYHNTTADDNRHSRGAMANPENFWAFSCPSPDSNASRSGGRSGIVAGMSSAALQVNDEIWQFPRTPVALVARPTDTGYDLVARALMLNSHAWDTTDDTGVVESSRNRAGSLENMIDWIKDADHDALSAATRTIAISTRDLVDLMRWVDLFAD